MELGQDIDVVTQNIGAIELTNEESAYYRSIEQPQEYNRLKSEQQSVMYQHDTIRHLYVEGGGDFQIHVIF